MIILVLPLFMRCSKVFQSFVIPFPLWNTFEVDVIGAYDDEFGFTSQEIRDAFEIPTDGQVDSVYVESVSLDILSRTGNEATGVYVSANVLSPLGWVPIFVNYLVTLPEVGEETTLSIGELNDAGIGELRDILEGIILAGQFVDISLNFESDSEPFNSRVVADITVNIVGTMIGGQCLDMPPLGDQESCDL
jgi:hypothetical protein